MFAVVSAEATGSRRLSGKGKSAAACTYQKRDMNTWLLHSVSVFFKGQMSPARFQQGWRICVPKKQQQHLPVDAGGTALTDSSHSGCWTYCMHSPQVFVLAESRTSVRKTGDVSEDSHTNFLQEWEKTTSKIPNPQISQDKYYILLLSHRNSP